jgi:hypothetical protein
MKKYKCPLNNILFNVTYLDNEAISSINNRGKLDIMKLFLERMKPYDDRNLSLANSLIHI